jgi:6,7-dimethyl-8-ribityllumazine synthase
MSVTEIQGHHDGSGLRIGIATARFNEFVTEQLLEGTLSRLRELGVKDENIVVARVPGSFELATAARQLASTDGNDMDAVICLGVVINGETAHFEHVATGATSGISAVQAESGKPVIFGVLTTFTTDQAVERADPGRQNVGGEYAEAAVEMANLRRTLADL